MNTSNWPNSRSLERYSELTGLDIRNFLLVGGIWIDVGCGQGIALQSMMTRENLELVGVDSEVFDFPPKIKHYSTVIPGDLEVLNTFTQSVRLCTDVFGGVSYCKDPVEAMIYEGLLLAAGGELRVSTRAERFGDSSQTHINMIRFFGRHFGSNLTFNEIESISDANGELVKVLQIVLTAPTRFSGLTIDRLVDLAHAEIGHPLEGPVVWRSLDGIKEIRQINYKLP